LFTLGLPIINMIWTWMRLKSGSLWPGVVLHATHNTLIQQFFSPLTVDTGKTNYAAGEFGAVLFAVIVVVATYFWTRRREVLPLKESADTAVLQPAS
jgi:membrane protease YdiL (CAAX protease family)